MDHAALAPHEVQFFSNQKKKLSSCVVCVCNINAGCAGVALLLLPDHHF